MHFPLSLLDMSLVLGIVALVLLITSELAMSHQERKLAIEKKVLSRSGLLFGVVFLLFIVLIIFQVTLTA